jgi:hypothetical protein
MQIGLLIQQGFQFVPVETAQAGGGYRFGGVKKGFIERQAQEVAGLQKPDDLPAAVRQHLVDPNNAGNDLIDAVRRIGFAENGAVAMIVSPDVV